MPRRPECRARRDPQLSRVAAVCPPPDHVRCLMSLRPAIGRPNLQWRDEPTGVLPLPPLRLGVLLRMSGRSPRLRWLSAAVLCLQIHCDTMAHRPGEECLIVELHPLVVHSLLPPEHHVDVHLGGP